MTDIEFVLWYINKNYLFNGSTMRYKYQHGETPFYFHSFHDRIKESTAIEKLDDKSLHDYLYVWFKTKQDEAKYDILDYIRYKYKVTLGPTNWVISTLGGEIVNTSDIIKCFKNKYDKEFIVPIVEDWYENELIRITETSTLHFK